jgi:hypothetical protein
MKRSSILVRTVAVALPSLVLGLACSADEGGDDSTQGMGQLQGGAGPGVMPGLGGAAPVGMGGAVPGASGSPGVEGQGGAPPVAGQGGMATSPVSGMGGAPTGMGGAPTGMGGAPTGMGGAAPMGMACIGSPSDGLTCTATCNDDCGIHNLGARLCACPGAEACDPGQTAPCYDCASCGYTANHPLLEPPTAAFMPCPQVDDLMEDDESGCMDNARCQSIDPDDGPGRFCGCLGNEWSCDSKPDNFAF